MDNKHGKLFVIKQSEGCRFMPKMHQNTFGGRGTAGGAYARPSSRNEAYFLRKGGKGREGRIWGLLLVGGRTGEGAYF